MNKNTYVLTLFLSLCCLGPTANSLENTSTETTRISSKAYDLLVRLEDLAKTANCKDALASAKTAIKSETYTDYEYAQITNIASYCYYLSGDYEGALKGYKKILKTNNLPDDFYFRTAQSLGAIFAEQDRYNEASRTIEEVIPLLETPKPDFFLLLANMLLRSKEEARAIYYLEKILNSSETKNNANEEQLLLTLFFAFEQAGKDERAIRYLEDLVEKSTKIEYLRYLSNMYGKVGRQKDQLAILVLLYENGGLEKLSDIETLIHLSIEQRNFHSAGVILLKGIQREVSWKNPDKYFLLSQIWFKANNIKEGSKALKRAALLSQSGVYFLELARFQGSSNEWKASTDSAKKAIEKGLSSSQRDEANLIIGQSLYNEGNLAGARAHFLVISADAKFFDQAKNWVRHINKIHKTDS